MTNTTLTRRTVLRTAALMTAAATAPFVRRAGAVGNVVPSGNMVLAWHTNIASRWLDPQQHDGTASPDNFIFALHDALIKNFREVRYDHPALAEGFDFAEDAKSATFKLRPGIKFHDGSPVTPDDVKWSYEHYRGAWGDVLHKNTDGVEVVGADTVRFHFKEAFFDFPSCSAPEMCAAPVGSSRRNTTSRSGSPVLCRSRLAPGHTSSSRSNRGCGSSSRRSKTITGRSTSSS